MNEVLLNNYLTTNWGNWSSSMPCEKKVWMELNTLHLMVVGNVPRDIKTVGLGRNLSKTPVIYGKFS